MFHGGFFHAPRYIERIVSFTIPFWPAWGVLTPCGFFHAHTINNNMMIQSNVWEWQEALTTVNDCKEQLTRLGWQVSCIDAEKYTITIERVE